MFKGFKVLSQYMYKEYLLRNVFISINLKAVSYDKKWSTKLKTKLSHSLFIPCFFSRVVMCQQRSVGYHQQTGYLHDQGPVTGSQQGRVLSLWNSVRHQPFYSMPHNIHWYWQMSQVRYCHSNVNYNWAKQNVHVISLFETLK